MMLFLQPRCIFTLAVFFLHLMYQETAAEIPQVLEDSNENIYDNLLQREYAGPVIFPNHQVERKAQRSPSLRLRFGRRSDPQMIPMNQKRWFGDVDQKPIRSPSLRLRFGRRSDPAMPIHSDFDVMMNSDYQENPIDVYGNEDVFQRIIRSQPKHLRWGRSVNYDSEAEANFEEENDRELLNALMNSEVLRQLLHTLRQYELENPEDNANLFLREARKQAPLRLRWGRSTGGKNTMLAEEKKLNAEKIQGDVPNKA